MTQPAWLDRLGVELEGAFYNNVAHLVPGSRMKHDGSVEEIDIDDDATDAGRRGDEVVFPDGELITPPLRLEAMVAAIPRLYPDAVNATCGMHVHMSFTDDVHYFRLLTSEFEDYLIRWLTAWADDNASTLGRINKRWLMDRLAGENRYCAKGSANAVSGGMYGLGNGLSHEGRYHMINTHSRGRFATLEFRLLPAFRRSDMAVSAIKALVECVDAFITDDRGNVVKDAKGKRPAAPPTLSIRLAGKSARHAPLPPVVVSTSIVRIKRAPPPLPGTTRAYIVNGKTTLGRISGEE